MKVETALEQDLAAVARAVRVNSALLLGTQLGLDMRDTTQAAKAFRYLTVVEGQAGGEGDE